MKALSSVAQGRRGHRRPPIEHLAPVGHVGGGPIREHHRVAEARKARIRRLAQGRYDFAQHAEVVHRTRAVGEEHRAGVRLREDIGHVLGAEARVHRDEDSADLDDGEHRVDPLGTVDHPEGNLVPRRDAE